MREALATTANISKSHVLIEYSSLSYPHTLVVGSSLERIKYNHDPNHHLRLVRVERELEALLALQRSLLLFENMPTNSLAGPQIFLQTQSRF